MTEHTRAPSLSKSDNRSEELHFAADHVMLRGFFEDALC